MNGTNCGRGEKSSWVRRFNSTELRMLQGSADAGSPPATLALDDFFFKTFGSAADEQRVDVAAFLHEFDEVGIRLSDARLATTVDALRLATDELHSVDRDTFTQCVTGNISFISKVLQKRLIVPDWEAFCTHINEIYLSCKDNVDGNVATYIPQLARVKPNLWGVSVCTIDGQRRSWGDCKLPFCLQSVSKPFTYAVALNDLGADEVHARVGQEPSGRNFNDICLDHNHRPHNPMINAGAILLASLIKTDSPMSDRFAYMLDRFRQFAASENVGFDNATFLSERNTADRNYALAYYMREYKCFPDGADLHESVDLYFQLCSLETDCEAAAVMAATLANGGVNPLTNERIVSNRSCRDVLSLMYSCGMYDYSGQFAFRVGLPAKSGVSGAMLVVVPNVMGLCLFSPRLDELGNTVRGVRFSQELVERFNFHNYDSLLHAESQKVDPRRCVCERQQENTVHLLFAAKAGDLYGVKRYILKGADVDGADYDGRTALHVAASEGHAPVVAFLVDRWHAALEPRDRWNHTPLDEARSFGHDHCAELLEAALTNGHCRQHD